MRRILAAALLFFASVSSAVADDAAMRGAAEGFYGVYRTFHPSDGIPDAAGRARYAPFVSPRLAALLQQAGDAQARFSAANKDSPPLVEGDLFTSLFEGATAVSLGACSGDASRGQCIANLSRADPAAGPLNWSDTVYLVATPAGWRVDDIGYGGAWDSGNKGRLSETLGQAIHFP